MINEMDVLQVYKDAKGVYEDNDMYQNAKAAIRVWENGDPVVQNNRIWGGKSVGLLCYTFGKGHYVGNDIYGHKQWNIEARMYSMRPDICVVVVEVVVATASTTS